MNSDLTVKNILFRRNLIFFSGLAVVSLLASVSSVIVDFDFLKGLESFPKAISWMARNFVPDSKALANLPKILTRLGETILVSVMASVASAAVAIVLAIISSQTTRPHPAFSLPVRLFSSLCRNIPVVAWAMIFLLSFGQSVLTGFLALFIGTVGYLTRAFTETIDEAAQSSVEAMRATGATWLPCILQAVMPSVMPQVASWMLYMVETNIRDATLVGILTGTGIGFLFDLYYKSMQYPSAAAVVLAIVATVLVIETISNAIRRIIL